MQRTHQMARYIEYKQEFIAKAMMLGEQYEFDVSDHTIWRNDPQPDNENQLFVLDADTLEVLDYSRPSVYAGRCAAVIEGRLGFRAATRYPPDYLER